MDFVIEYKGKVFPSEIKSGKNYKRHSALCNIMEISNYSIDEAFVFTNQNSSICPECKCKFFEMSADF